MPTVFPHDEPKMPEAAQLARRPHGRGSAERPPMPPRLRGGRGRGRGLAVAAALGALGLLSSVGLADGTKIVRPFTCHVPAVGTTRCGDLQRNYRVGPKVRVSVKIDKAVPDIAIIFYLKHAVSGKQLAETTAHKGDPVAVWTNPQDEAVDVSFEAKTDSYAGSTIEGNFTFE